MPRPGITPVQFNEAMAEFVSAGSSPSKVTLKMLAERLPASNSTLVKMRNAYLEAHPETKPVARELPIDIVASIESYGDRRESVAREELGNQLAQAKAAEVALLTETKELGDELEEVRATSAQLGSRNSELTGQLEQQVREIAELKDMLSKVQGRLSLTERDFHAAQAIAQAADGRVQEIRSSADRQMEQLRAELAQARAGQVDAERRVASAVSEAAAAKAHLVGLQEAQASRQSHLDEVQASVRRLEPEAVRAAAAAAEVDGLKREVARQDETIAMLRDLCARPAGAVATPATT
ncbi:hypothetical protein [Scleromatobacter humisilvae]|uniref:KfrA N-terminal DNA-binding domain-containing protein n=1 Tax=Scleromatobacter humisilvae TaxID=2897159 RepID=A0A9X2C3C9_9BURK|nr:hypothetical protein [Scleromatobacter humisilvae]MCK9687260.1 hypothetical protein [Scleromatobacter humisilvae]